MENDVLNLISGGMELPIPQTMLDYIARRNLASFMQDWGILRAAGTRDFQRFAKMQGLHPDDMIDQPDHLDHVRMYVTQEGRLVIVSEPYEIRMQEMQRIMDFCSRNGWKFTITSRYGRHNPTRTVTMVLETNLVLDSHHL